MKKILSLALALALVLSLFAGIAVAETATPTTLTLGIMNLSANEDKDWYPDMWIAGVNKALNCYIEWTKYDTDMMATGLASGDLKDVMMANDPLPVLAAGAAVDMDPYLEEYGPNIAKYELRNAMLRKYLSNGEGKLYFHTLVPKS